MCKIIGFIKRVDGYQTARGFINSATFKNACLEAATVTGIPPSALCTQRQARKFLKAKGIVFQHINHGPSGHING